MKWIYSFPIEGISHVEDPVCKLLLAHFHVFFNLLAAFSSDGTISPILTQKLTMVIVPLRQNGKRFEIKC